MEQFSARGTVALKNPTQATIDTQEIGTALSIENMRPIELTTVLRQQHALGATTPWQRYASAPAIAIAIAIAIGM